MILSSVLKKAPPYQEKHMNTKRNVFNAILFAIALIPLLLAVALLASPARADASGAADRIDSLLPLRLPTLVNLDRQARVVVPFSRGVPPALLPVPHSMA